MTKKIKKSNGVKYDNQKERVDLIPASALMEIGKINTFGSSKYADRNWEQGLKWNRLYGALLRHLFKFWEGEDYDDETGLLHIAHAAWNALALLHYQLFYTIYKKFDNRPKYRQTFGVNKNKEEK